MKKTLALLLASMLILGCFSFASAEEALEPVTLKIMFDGCTVTDDTAVLEKVNEYLGEKLNVTLQPIWGTWGDFEDRAVMSINAGDDIDMYFTCSWTRNEYNAYAAKGAWVRLDDPENNLIEKYAADLWEILPDPLKTGATIEGTAGFGVYGIPGYKDSATQLTWDVNVDLLEKYGYTLADIENTDYYGFGDILATVKAGEGEDFYPLIVEPMVMERMVNNTIIVTGDSGSSNLLSYIIDSEDPSKDIGSTMVNKFATEDFKKFAEKTREYYLAGYIEPGLAIREQSNEIRTQRQLDAKYLISTQSYALGYEAETSVKRNIQVAYVPTTPAYVDTAVSQGSFYAVSTASKNPERSVMFLNLLNTDSYLMTLLAYGVEGVHYNLTDEGLVEFTDKRDDFMPWRNGMGNITLLPPQAGEGVGFWDTFKAYYGAAKSIPSLGFIFDPTPVQNEHAALSNVAEEYALAICTGTMDVEEKLPEFLQKLEEAGIQKYVDEANAQFQAFLAK